MRSLCNIRLEGTQIKHTMSTCSGVVRTGMCVYILVPSTPLNLMELRIMNRKKLLTWETVYEQRRKMLSGKRSQRRRDRMGMMTGLYLNI